MFNWKKLTLVLLFLVMAGVFLIGQNAAAQSSSDLPCIYGGSKEACEKMGEKSGWTSCKQDAQSCWAPEPLSDEEIEKIAYSSGVKGLLKNTVVSVLGFVFGIFNKILAGILSFVGGAFDVVFKVQRFTDLAAITFGWSVVRDVCNMFFILIAIVIAIATILRVGIFENYSMKRALPRLIIIALLINFSLVICSVLIDFSQVAMLTFVPSGQYFAVELANQANIPVGFKSAASLPPDEVLVKQAFHGIMLFVAILALGAITMLLVIRMVVLWILCIMAPLAWLASILPGTQKYAQQWWNIFMKYLIYGPAVAFLLYIIVRIHQSGTIIQQVHTLEQSVAGASGISGALGGIVLPMINYVFLIVLLFVALLSVRIFGIWGGSAITKWGTGVASYAGERFSGLRWAKRRWRAGESARKDLAEDRYKERKKQKLNAGRLSAVGGIGQKIREKYSPTAAGKAEAIALKNERITSEAKRLGKTMDMQSVYKIAGSRAPLTAAGRMQKLAAQALLSNPGSAEYTQMQSRTVVPTSGRKYRNFYNLSARVDKEVTNKQAQGKLNRYKW